MISMAQNNRFGEPGQNMFNQVLKTFNEWEQLGVKSDE
jgi:hypothetical protein